MVSLKQTPTLLAFLNQLFQFANIKFRNKLEDNLMLHSQCKCGDKDCATVTLKRAKPWKKKIEGSHHWINTNKGFIIIHFSKQGFLEVEALNYETFPYKKEIDKFFKSHCKLKSTLDKRAIDSYFSDLKNEEMNIIDLGDLNV